MFCSPCHGLSGYGDGMVVQRGFPHPPSFYSQRLLAADVRHFYNVQTKGFGVMYSYADRVSEQDRWAIAAYIRALTGFPACDARHGAGSSGEGQMNGVAHRPGRSMAQTVFIAAAIAITVLFFVFPKEAARGWLIAFSIFSQIGLGSLALLLIHNLTSNPLGRGLRPGAQAAFVGCAAAGNLLHRHRVHLARDLSLGRYAGIDPARCGAHYLNPAGFWLRSAVALAGWILFATLLLIGSDRRLSAALGLTFFGLSSYVLGYDWILSIGAPFISSSFNAEMAIQAMLAALATAALFAPASRMTGQDRTLARS